VPAPGAKQRALLATLVTGSTGGTDLEGERHYSGQQAYSQSKLAKVMITAPRPFLKTPAQAAATSICLSGKRHNRLAVLRPGRVRPGAD
jgi:hypothetical protein